jgi:membrane fusion protein, multidrug efflux system
MLMKKILNNRVTRKLLVLVPLLLASLVFVVLMLGIKKTPKKPVKETAQVYRVIPAPAMDVIPRVLGYGVAEPARVWRAIARVEGRIDKVNPMLRSGATIGAGVELLQIDPTPYEVAVDQAKATIGRTKAALAEYNQQVKNDGASLKIQQASLKIARRQFERSRGLLEKDAISQSQVDNDERAMLDQQKIVQDLKNNLNLAPSTRAAKKADIAASQAELKDAELDLSYTAVRTPFRVMLAEVGVEQGQFVKTGERLFDGYGTRIAKVDAEIPHEKISRLLDPVTLQKLQGALRSSQRNRALEGLFEVTVRFFSGPNVVEWPGRMVGTRELVDAQTRSVVLIVAVDGPYEQARAGDKPPLLKGTYCEVEFRGAALAQRIVIPRAAIYDSHVYVLNNTNRLQRRTVKIAFEQSDFAVIKDGLKPEERVVVSELTPAIEGLLVEPVNDTELLERLHQEAAGTEPLR